MATQLADAMTSTLSNPVANGPMAQSTADFLKSLNLGDNLQSLMDGSWKDSLGSGAAGKLVSDADLFNAFDGLKSTAKGLGMVLPAESVGNWSALAQAATDAGTVKDFLTVLPVLLKVGGKAGSLPVAAKTAVNTLQNLAIDALENSALAGAALVSLGLGLGASITGIVGGALFIAGASVLLGAGVDSLDTDKLMSKYGDNAFVKDFVDLARSTSSTVLPQALQGVYAIDPLDFGLQVLQTTVDVVGGGPLAAGA